MGPTTWIPGTHTAEMHERFRGGGAGVGGGAYDSASAGPVGGVDDVDVDVDDDATRSARGPLLDALPTPVRPAHFDTTVITAGTLAGSTVGYSVGVRRLWLGLVFFGRVSRCPLVAFFLACLAARTVNVIGAPIVARAMMRGRPRARACVCGRAAGSTAGTRPRHACVRPCVRARTLARVVTALEH